MSRDVRYAPLSHPPAASQAATTRRGKTLVGICLATAALSVLWLSHSSERVETLLAPTQKTSGPASTIPDSTRLNLEPTRLANAYEESLGEKYLGYLPHSGWNNQRSALANALYLAALLNRTLLVPPVWVGWPTGLEFYPELQHTWDRQVLSHAANFNLSLASDSSAILAMPANGTMFPSTELDFPSHSGFNLTERLRIANESRTARQAKLKSLGYQILPNGFATLSGASENGAHALSAKESTRLTEEECKSFSEECRALYQGGQLDTFVAWDSLVGDGLDRLRKEGLVKTRDRWDLREAKVLEYARALDDVLVFEDSEKYDFQFVDHYFSRRKERTKRPLISNSTRQNHFVRAVSIPAMRKLPHRVLLVGSLFGHRRVFSELEADDRGGGGGDTLFERITSSLSISTPWVLEPAREVRDLISTGSEGGYVGVHARVGDGKFEKNQVENMWELWRRLGSELGVKDEDLKQEEDRVRRVLEEEKSDMSDHERGAGSVKDRRSLGSIPAVGSDWNLIEDDNDEQDESRAQLTESRRLRNRQSLTKRDASSPTPSFPKQACSVASTDTIRDSLFNTPVYLATDAASPTTSLALRPFFISYPCVYVLSDFSHLESVSRLDQLVHDRDGARLERLLVPFLEAVVASMGRIVIGTKGSTFSAYAETTLHKAFASAET